MHKLTTQKFVCSNRIQNPRGFHHREPSTKGSELELQTITIKMNFSNKKKKSNVMSLKKKTKINLKFLILQSGRLLQIIWVTRRLEK
jgi:hypothetical protein